MLQKSLKNINCFSFFPKISPFLTKGLIFLYPILLF